MRQLLLGCVLAFDVNCFAQFIPPPGDGGDSGTNGSSFLLNTNRNHIKFMGHVFSFLDTNAVALSDTNLYSALLAFPGITNTDPAIQVLPYGSDTILIKASHFDYSGESTREFALLVCDKAETPVWKDVDFSGTANSQDGWLVQGAVPAWQVTDSMFFKVSNIARDCNAFFRVIPYGGPQVVLSGFQPNDVVSNTITLHAAITDLSGVTNVQFELNVDEMAARYGLGASNTITIETKYNRNGLANIYANAFNDNARIYDPTNLPDNSKLFFSGMGTLPLDFENDTYLAFASDMCPLEVGTNNILFVIDKAQQIEATISDPADGHVVASYAGTVPFPATIAIPWDFTEADGVTPYSNDTYVVTFTAFDPTTLIITNRLDKGGNLRNPGGCFLTYQYEDPSTPTGTYLNQHADTAIKLNLTFLFQWIYSPISITQYEVEVVGPNRNMAQCLPYDMPSHTWATNLPSLTNDNFSELTIAQAHGSGATIGGGDYVTLSDRFDSQDLMLWIKACSDRNHWRLRKAALFTCYSAVIQATAVDGYPTWPAACGIRPAGDQGNSLMYKNCGLFFGGLLPQGDYGIAIGENKITAEVAEVLDQTWVCGKNQYPGGCDPTYSYDFAIQTTIGMYPELVKAIPSRAGFGQCVYSSIYDDELRNLDTSHVKNN
jgi:hypothetical protein